VLDKGPIDVNEYAFGNIVHPDESFIFIRGTSDTEYSYNEPDPDIMILISGTTTGTYSLLEAYDEAMLFIIEDGKAHHSVSGSIVITAIGEVGGVIEGIFSGGVIHEDGYGLGLSNGVIKVQHLAEDTYMEFF